MKKYQLMAPGPTPAPSEVLLEIAQPILHHRTPEYEALFIVVLAGLKRLVQTSQDVIPLACSGTGASNQVASCKGGYPDGGGIKDMSPYSRNAGSFQPDCEGRY